MNARIIVMECADENRLERFLFGGWFWQARIPGKGVRHGSAWTEARARAKAEAAARKLAATNSGKFEQYSLPLDS